MTTEQLLMAGMAALTGAIGVLFKIVHAEAVNCREDRKKLWDQVWRLSRQLGAKLSNHSIDMESDIDEGKSKA